MHLKSAVSTALFTLLTLPYVTQGRALTQRDLAYPGGSDNGQVLPTGLDQDKKRTVAVSFGSRGLNARVVEPIIEPPPVKPVPHDTDPTTPTNPDDGGGSTGGAIDPDAPSTGGGDSGTGGAIDPDAPSTGGGDKDPAATDPDTPAPAPAKPDDPTNPAPAADGEFSKDLDTISDADKAELCKRSDAHLLPRSFCGPGSGDETVGASGFDSEPAVPAEEPNAPAAKIDRTKVKNWYDVTKSENPPPFSAGEALAARKRGEGKDADIPDLTNKYKIGGGELKTIFAKDSDVIGQMWAKLGKKAPEGEADFSIIKATPGTQAGDIVQQSAFARDGSFIIAQFSKRDHDGNTEKVRWNQLLMHEFSGAMEAEGKATTGVLGIGRLQIAEPPTQATLRQALKEVDKTSNSPEDVVTFRADAAAGSAEKLGFDTISRTDNVNGVYWFLSDYFDKLGKKDILAIHVAKDGPGDLDDFHLIIEIG